MGSDTGLSKSQVWLLTDRKPQFCTSRIIHLLPMKEVGTLLLAVHYFYILKFLNRKNIFHKEGTNSDYFMWLYLKEVL